MESSITMSEKDLGNDKMIYLYPNNVEFENVFGILDITSFEKEKLLNDIQNYITDYNTLSEFKNTEKYTFDFETEYVNYSTNITIGKFHGQFITLYLTFFTMNGLKFISYTPTSDVYDLSIIRKWLSEHFKEAYPDNFYCASTFYVCIYNVLDKTFHKMKAKERKDKIDKLLK